MADANEVWVIVSRISCIRRSLDGYHSFIDSHFSLLQCCCTLPTSWNIQLWFVVICHVIRWDCSFAFVTFVASSLRGLLEPLQTNVSFGLPIVSQSTISRLERTSSTISQSNLLEVLLWNARPMTNFKNSSWSHLKEVRNMLNLWSNGRSTLLTNNLVVIYMVSGMKNQSTILVRFYALFMIRWILQKLPFRGCRLQQRLLKVWANCPWI